MQPCTLNRASGQAGDPPGRSANPLLFWIAAALAVLALLAALAAPRVMARA